MYKSTNNFCHVMLWQWMLRCGTEKPTALCVNLMGISIGTHLHPNMQKDDDRYLNWKKAHRQQQLWQFKPLTGNKPSLKPGCTFLSFFLSLPLSQSPWRLWSLYEKQASIYCIMRKSEMKPGRTCCFSYVLSSHIAHEWVTGRHDGDQTSFKGSVGTFVSLRPSF